MAHQARFCHSAGWFLCFSFALSGVSRAVSITVENLSNDTIYVGTANANFVGNYGGAGWTAVRTNEKKKFTSPDSGDLHLRVQNSNGNEITWDNYNAFKKFAV